MGFKALGVVRGQGLKNKNGCLCGVWRPQMVHLRLVVPCHSQPLLKDHHLSSGSITLTTGTAVIPFLALDR